MSPFACRALLLLGLVALASAAEGVRAVMPAPPEDRPVVDITATYDPARGALVGTAHYRWTNTSADAWPGLGFHLQPNRPYYGRDSSLKITEIRRGDQVLDQHDDRGHGLVVRLEEPLAPGQSISLELDFVGTVPEEAGRAGLYSRSDHAHVLYSWFPEMAVWRDGGWVLPALPLQSDPSHVPIHDLNVNLSLPNGWRVVASGREFAPDEMGKPWRIEAPAVRNGVICVLRDFQELAGDALGGDTRVRVHSRPYLPRERVLGRMDDALRAAVSSLNRFDAWYGPYPYFEFDVVLVPLGFGVAGMEASGIVLIHDGLMWQEPLADADLPGSERLDSLETTVVHEVAHQWWYGVVGNDTWSEAWLDEPLVTWATLTWTRAEHGEETAKASATSRAELWPTFVSSRQDKPLTSDADELGLMGFGILLYGKGPLMYEALALEIGDRRLRHAVRQWYLDRAWTIADGSAWMKHFPPLILDDARRAGFIAEWLTEAGHVPNRIGELVYPRGFLKPWVPIGPANDPTP